MKLNKSAILFSIDSIPMIGNVDTGYIIGLTSEGFELCSCMKREEISKEEICKVDHGLFDHLLKGNYFQGQFSKRVLRSAYLHITQKCNQNCVGCYSFNSARNSANDLPAVFIFRIIDKIAEAGVQKVIISGGEPFLRSDLLAILRYIKTKISTVDIITNGSLLHEYDLKAFSPFLDSISISFGNLTQTDSCSMRKDFSLQEAVCAVKYVKDSGIPVKILPTLHAGNLKDIKKYKDIACALDVPLSFSLLSLPSLEFKKSCLIPNEFQLNELAKTLIELRDDRVFSSITETTNVALRARKSCGLGCETVSIDHKGDLYPCHMLQYEQFCGGSIIHKEVDIDLAVRSFSKICVDEIEDCRECKYKYICGGGCRARAFFSSGNLYARDPYCSLLKKFYQLYFDLIKTGIAIDKREEKQ